MFKIYKKIIEDIELLHPVYFFYGTETFLMEEALKRLEEKMKQERDFGNVVYFDLEESPIQNMVEEAETASLFGGSRVIVGKNAMFVTSSKIKVEHQEKVLFSYLEKPVTENAIVLIAPLDKLDKRKKVTKLLLQNACTIHFQPLKEKEIYLWLVEHLKLYQVTIGSKEAQKLIELVGNNTWLLHQECEKLVTYIGQNGTVTLQTIEEMVPRTLEQDVFKLMDLLMNKKSEEALQLWSDLLFLAQEPLRILVLLIRQLRLTLQVKLMGERSDKEIASLLKVHPYPIKLARKQALLFSEQALRMYLYQAIQSEEESKLGLINKQVAVEKILFLMSEEGVVSCKDIT